MSNSNFLALFFCVWVLTISSSRKSERWFVFFLRSRGKSVEHIRYQSLESEERKIPMSETCLGKFSYFAHVLDLPFWTFPLKIGTGPFSQRLSLLFLSSLFFDKKVSAFLTFDPFPFSALQLWRLGKAEEKSIISFLSSSWNFSLRSCPVHMYVVGPRNRKICRARFPEEQVE